MKIGIKTIRSVEQRAHELCDFITENGGTVKLGNEAFNAFCHMLYDLIESNQVRRDSDEDDPFGELPA